jgi:prepilin peptidase CpaA
VGSLAAVVEDVRRRQISNVTTVGILAAGIGWQVWSHGWKGAGSSALGVLAGGGVFLIFYLLGGMGAGDVKLMAGFGALLGAKGILVAALWTAAAGGLGAAAVCGYGAARNCLRRQLSQGAAKAAESIPYAPAIAVGVCLSVLSGAGV